MNTPIDIIVGTPNPDYLDRVLQELPGCAAVVVGGGTPGGYVKQDGGYLVRCFAGLDFLEFALQNQGYGTIVKHLGPPQPPDLEEDEAEDYLDRAWRLTHFYDYTTNREIPKPQPPLLFGPRQGDYIVYCGRPDLPGYQKPDGNGCVVRVRAVILARSFVKIYVSPSERMYKLTRRKPKK